MRGSDVAQLQSILELIGYNPGEIDGIFGTRTEEAVKAFQRNNGLSPDGIVGPKTYEKLEPIMLGYDVYTIKKGDTLFNIAQRYHTTVYAITTANPDINPFFLKYREEIIVPFGIDVVQTNILYNYDVMEKDIRGLEMRYPF